jgi:uncharacterized protein (DUF3820 family)
MDVISYCREQYECTDLQNCVRVNGVVDIYKKQKTGKISVFVIPEQTWFYPQSEEEFADLVINMVDHYPPRPAFKKLPSGRMAYQEFKHQERSHHKKTKRFNVKDTDLMPFGQHKGEKMANVPADYLIWLFENGKCFGAVLNYIKANEQNLRQEIANNKKGIR